MFISLEQLEKRPVAFDVDLDAGEISYGGEITQCSDLHAEGSAELLNRSVADIRVHGRLTVCVQAPCDRCTENSTHKIDDAFDLVYMPAGESGGGEQEVDATGIEIGYYEGNGLALNDVLREVVLLAMPMQLICSEDCKGICPVCGQNRNQRECGCHAETSDERWSKLKTIRAEIGPRN